MRQFQSAVEVCHRLMKQSVREGCIVVDATCGNGHDTELLSKLVGEKGMVYGFDIQKQAIESTAQRLEQANLSNRVRLILDGHENVADYVSETIDFAVFNLGWLPGGNHNVHTNYETTAQALKAILEMLRPDGMVIVVIYWGKSSGTEEKEQLLAYLEEIDYRKYDVVVHSYINKPNQPPICVAIKKIF